MVASSASYLVLEQEGAQAAHLLGCLDNVLSRMQALGILQELLYPCIHGIQPLCELAWRAANFASTGRSHTFPHLLPCNNSS